MSTLINNLFSPQLSKKPAVRAKLQHLPWFYKTFGLSPTLLDFLAFFLNATYDKNELLDFFIVDTQLSPSWTQSNSFLFAPSEANLTGAPSSKKQKRISISSNEWTPKVILKQLEYKIFFFWTHTTESNNHQIQL